MAVASFEDLCAGLCDLVQVPLPSLKEDSLGRVGFHVLLRGATVNLVHCPHACPDHVFVLFEFGPVRQDGPGSLADLQTLLDANFVLLQVNPPVFSRNPGTGDVVLQYVFKLFDATPHDLYALIDGGVHMVAQWRDGTSQDGHGTTAGLSAVAAFSQQDSHPGHDFSRFA